MEKYEVTVLRPDFYDDFHCKGPDCQYTCCQGWRVDIDKKTFKIYHNLRQPKDLADKLKKHVVRSKVGDDKKRYGIITMAGADGKCPFQNEKGLCDIQLALGENQLSLTCRQYPRVKNLFLGKEEPKLQYSFSVSCERVLEMLLAEQEGVGFIEEKLSVDKQPWNGGIGRISIGEKPLKAHWEEIQYLSIDILQDRRYPLEKRLLFLGLFCQRLMKVSAEEAMEMIQEFRNNHFDGGIFVQINDLPEADASEQLSFCTNIFNHTEISYQFLRYEIMQTIIVNLHLPVSGAEFLGLGQSAGDPLLGYIQAYKNYQRYMADKEHLLENILVMEIMSKIFPFSGAVGDIWENYLWLCCLFMVLRFIIVGMLGEKGELSQEKLINTLAIVGRIVMHGSALQKGGLTYMKDNDLTSLAKVHTLLASPKV